MNALTQIITQQLSGNASRTIAQRFGISEATANTAVQVAVPLILAALARNANQPQGAESLHQAINQDHDGSIFDNLMGYVSNPQSANGAGILGHVFGGQKPVIENNLAQATGIDQGSAGGLLETLAPLVMGAVGRAQQQNNSTLPVFQAFSINSNNKHKMNAPGSHERPQLNAGNQNNDGSAIDDLKRMAGGFFK